MRLSRRDFLRAAATAVAAGRLAPSALAQLGELFAGRAAPRVIWIQGAGCDGCAISLLNSINLAGADDLLTSTLDVRFQNNLMASAGDLAISVAEAATAQPGYILVVEGAVPTGAAGRYCRLWSGMTMLQGVQTLSANAAFIVALGSCAAFGGVSGGAPNPTAAQGVGATIGNDARLVNVPGCPAHPDWLVGTLTYLMTNNRVPPVDEHRRPLEFYGTRVHDRCHNRHKLCGAPVLAPQLGGEGCLEYLGCKGKKSYSDCPLRKWNSGGPGQYGVNWCVGARSPCLGCVQPDYPDAMSPFYVYSPTPETKPAGDEGVE